MNKILLFFISFWGCSASSPAQGIHENNGSIFLLKVDSLGSIAGLRTVESTSHSYGYALEKRKDSVLVYCYTKGYIEIDSFMYIPDSSNNLNSKIRLAFDDSLLHCIELSQSHDVSLGQVSGTCGDQCYLVSTIADTFRSINQSIPNIGNTDIQISLIERNIAKWTTIYGTPFIEVAYAILFDSLEKAYYVTGFCEIPDSSTNNLQKTILTPEQSWSSSAERSVIGRQDSVSQKIIEIVTVEPIKYQVYPNPFSDELFILGSETFKGKEETISYRIITASGVTVREGKIKSQTNVLNGFEDLPSGVYFVEITGPEHHRLTYRVIKK